MCEGLFKRKANGKCEGRKSLAEMYPAVAREAKHLGRANPKTGERRSLRRIAAELVKMGGGARGNRRAWCEESGSSLPRPQWQAI